MEQKPGLLLHAWWNNRPGSLSYRAKSNLKGWSFHDGGLLLGDFIAEPDKVGMLYKNTNVLAMIRRDYYGRIIL